MLTRIPISLLEKNSGVTACNSLHTFTFYRELKKVTPEIIYFIGNNSERKSQTLPEKEYIIREKNLEPPIIGIRPHDALRSDLEIPDFDHTGW